MPISAEQWRVKTGMINASRGFRQHSIKPPSLCEFPLTPPPSDWKGYNLALTLLCLPLLYKTYTLGATVIMYLVRGEIYKYGWVTHNSYYADTLNQQHGSILGLLLSSSFYLVMMMMALVMSVCEYRERDKHQWRLIQPLHQLKFIWFDVVAAGREGSLQVVPKMVTGCVYATFVMEWQNTLKCVLMRTSINTVKTATKKKTTGHVVAFVSFILQLSTIALAMLLLLAGDVERNPGPLIDEDSIKALVNELKPVMSKYHGIGLQLGVKAARIEVIEQDHPFTERRLTEVLLFWLRGNTDVPTCWKSIIDALIHVDRRQLAEELAGKYCDKTKLGLLSERSVQASATVQERGGKIPFPVLDTSLLDDTQKQRCQKLSADMDKLNEKFQGLFNSISVSLEERKIPIIKIVTTIRTFQAYEPVYPNGDSQPILEHRMTELKNAKTIDDFMFIIGEYSSFFNYHLVEYIIKFLGTDEDKKQLSQYEEEYKCFAECMVYECPTKFQGPVDTQTQREFVVKVDDTFERCTLSHLKRFINKLSKILKLSEGTLLLESIRRGCLELTLQSPLFVYERIFPLSSDQESALAALGVIKISAGDYQYPHHSQDEPDSDDNDDKPDDGSGPGGGRGDSGIDTLTTILSELSEISEEVMNMDSSDPYDIDQDPRKRAEKQSNSTAAQSATPLHIAAYHGNLDYVKTLIDSKKFNPLETDGHGSTALHYAIIGCSLDVVKYLTDEHYCNPTQFGEHGETPLHIACRRGDLKTVKYLVTDLQVDPMCEDEDRGITPLHSACIGGNIDIVHFLVEEMCEYVSITEVADDKTNDGNTPIHYAAMCGNLNVMKYFLSELNCDPNICGERGTAPLHKAADGGHLEVVKYLIDTKKCDPTQLDDRKRTPLMYAARSKSLKTVKYLTQDAKCDPMCKDMYGDIALHYAALIGPVEVVDYFISVLKCDPNALGMDSSTPLHAASQAGCVEVMEYLIDIKHCNPSMSCGDKKFTPLHSAATFGRLNAVIYLTRTKNCDPVCRNSDGNTPLYFSALWGHLKTVKFFVFGLKCDPNIRCQYGSTPLHVASEQGHLEIMKYLIDVQKCNPSIQNDLGATPLHYAALEGHLDAVKYLTTEKCCDPHCRTYIRQDTPLHWAVFQHQNEIVDFFIAELDCDPNLPNGQGISPLFFAVAKGNLDIIKILMQNEEPYESSPMDAKSKTYLHMAAEFGHLNVVKFLISELNMKPDIVDYKGLTPLQYAVKSGNTELVQYLMEVKAAPPSKESSSKYSAKRTGPKKLSQKQSSSTNVSVEGTGVKHIVKSSTSKYSHQASPFNSKEEMDLLQNSYFVVSYEDVPKEKDSDKFYERRGKDVWIFMAEITNGGYSHTMGQLHHGQILVCDRTGKDNIPVYFHPTSSTQVADFTAEKGHTLLVMEAKKRYFQDGTPPGIIIEELASVMVVPCAMQDLLTLSALYYDRQNERCWSCGKNEADGGDSGSIKLLKCKACQVAYYCDRNCQAKDWKARHCRWCKVMPKYMELVHLFMTISFRHLSPWHRK